jgi:hypothetical protein
LANAIPAGVTGRASIPAEASRQGGLNETTPAEQRARKSNTELELSSGPKIGPNDEYQPASYEITHTAEATADRPAQTIKMIRTDR